MTARRISRGTPYILSSTDMENALAALTPRMEESIAAVLDMPHGEWRAQPLAAKVRQLIDHQTRGQAAAAFATAAKAQTDLEEAAHAITAQAEASVLRDEVAALRDMVAELLKTTDKPASTSRKGK